MSQPKHPVLIVGAGLAGLHLAWSLYLRKHPFKIINADRGLPAWRASAGIINPVTGKRVVKSWQIDTLLPFAQERYSTIADHLCQASAYHPQALFRYFRGDPDEIERFEKRRSEPDYAHYLSNNATQVDKGFEIAHAGWVDVAHFVESSRVFFSDLKQLEHSDQAFDPRLLGFTKDGLEWQNQTWSHIVFCEGYQGQNNPFFDWLDYRISRGDVIDFDKSPPLPMHISNREKWILPFSESSGRAGSSYTWEDLEKAPDLADCPPLLEAWSDIFPGIEKAHITRHRVGIRPGTNDSKPYAGPHPLDARICILNGFGSKGASQSPWCADILASYIESGAEIPLEIDPKRRLKFLKHPLTEPKSLRF